MLLSIIVPAYNEESLVCELLRKLVDLELPAGVETGDPGGERWILGPHPSKVQDFIASSGCACIRLLDHERNRGKGAAVRTGMQGAQGDIIIIQDADLEYDPEDIVNVIRPILEKQAKVVYGSRILREKELGRSGVCGLITGKHPHSYVLAYLGGVAITRWTNLLTGAALTDEPTCYKCFSRDAIMDLVIESDDFAWEPEVTMKILHKGIRIAEVPISYHPRKMEEGKKINWKDGVKALWTVWRYR